MERLFPFIDRNAGTVEILREVAKAILAEPKRYNQEQWIVYLADDRLPVAKERYPACGTMACVAGWTALLTDPTGTTKFSHDVESKAAEILNLSAWQAEKLFSGGAIQNLWYDKLEARGLRAPDGTLWSSHNYEDYEDSFPEPPAYGTPEYARLGVEHIENFVEKHLYGESKLGVEYEKVR